MRISNQIRFVIVGTQRTGSSLVATTINMHDEVSCGWEWTRDVSPFNKITIVQNGLSSRFEKLPEPHKSKMMKAVSPIIGFRLLFSSSPKWFFSPKLNVAHIWERLESFIKWFSKQPNIKIIHILRNDHLAWIASLYMAKATNQFIDSKYPTDLSVHIPLKQAIKRIIAKRHIEKKLRSLSLSNPYLETIYEDLVSNRDKNFKKILKFLEVDNPNNIPVSVTKKQQKRRIEEVISNYHEIKHLVDRCKSCSSIR